MRKVIIRVTGYVEDIMGTTILEEVNRGTYDEAINFIRTHPHSNIVWKIKPVVNDLYI